ncbi:2OG-Fe(II) oxygenase [Marinobacter sp. SS21]|uniref:2OG-Fe(II) oxygenase n=1 Tax=Marinobacter sp. SS21 TaxID=2979460 RepID=UPI00232B51BE|nr:2OG-Fe(II) oxygenase [Marinobacter sp. SS21]MDC0662430.1 2OG-Fe(II) oxygenase [Marinobacter sp. SS21]
MTAIQAARCDDGEGSRTHLYETIANDLRATGYSINVNALPQDLAESLWHYLQGLSNRAFDPAGIGRDRDRMLNNFVRSDEICWITGEDEPCRRWLAWASELQTYLNRRLLLGLFSFESHFAHYAPGDFYKKHLDAFKGEANRTLSLVAYLNPGWQPDDGGELVLYTGDDGLQSTRVTPGFGTVVAFLSEDFPHEVLPAARDRYSIAGWYRVNTSHAGRVDPPS